MIELAKLEGLRDAIQDEITRPSPSHNNLARLVTLFINMIIEDIRGRSFTTAEPKTVSTGETQSITTTNTEAPSEEPSEPTLKLKKSKKKHV